MEKRGKRVRAAETGRRNVTKDLEPIGREQPRGRDERRSEAVRNLKAYILAAGRRGQGRTIADAEQEIVGGEVPAEAMEDHIALDGGEDGGGGATAHESASEAPQVGSVAVGELSVTSADHGISDTSRGRGNVVPLAGRDSRKKKARPTGGAEAGGEDGATPKESPADRLLALAVERCELFHSPDGMGFATVDMGDHRETVRLRAKKFGNWLALIFYRDQGKPPGSQAIQNAMAVLEGKACFDGPTVPVHIRIAAHGDAIYLDLCDDLWHAVEVTRHGWRIIQNPPVRFQRRRGMLALPKPVRGGGSLELLLRPFVNATDDAWRLSVAWLVNAFRPGRPFPVLFLHGEQDSAKSSVAKVLRSLIDPNTVPLRSEPRDTRDLMIAATNAWLVVFDNLSRITPALSDDLCRLATGGGFGTRELRSDDEEKLFDATRPVILTGIEDLATRADLLSRALILDLPRISDERRRDETSFYPALDAARPAILGALLDVVASALRRLPDVQLRSRPRMVDFILFATAAEEALGWPPGTVCDAYRANQQTANAIALEASVLSPVILKFGAALPAPWEGSLDALLRSLSGIAEEEARHMPSWPKTPKTLGNSLRRLAASLRAAGVDVVQLPRRARERPWLVRRVERSGDSPSPSSPSEQHPVGASGGKPDDSRTEPESVVPTVMP